MIWCDFMFSLYKIFRLLLFFLDAEVAHNLAVLGLKTGAIFSLKKPTKPPELKVKIAGIEFENIIGLAAGFDKNAECLGGLFSFGFGFCEVGTVTPKPQSGNPKPRLFRLEKDKSIINRLGFNNCGLTQFTYNLLHFKTQNPHRIVGTNIGKNKDQTDAISDYLTCLEAVYPISDYITLNISSPNTQNLRNLQEGNELERLLEGVIDKRVSLIKNGAKYKPIFVKVAPDLDEMQVKNICKALKFYKIDGVIVANTTVQRPENLTNESKNIISKYGLTGQFGGGLSGVALKKISLEVLKLFYQNLEGEIPIISVGGVENADEVLERVRNGASLVQIYSAFIYEGFGLVERIKGDLKKKLKKIKCQNMLDLVGVDARKRAK
jgi:dihydroorotate dehydrogenase